MEETFETIFVIAGLMVCGFIAYVFVAAIYISIKDYFKRKILQIVRTEIARQIYIKNKQRNDKNE